MEYLTLGLLVLSIAGNGAAFYLINQFRQDTDQLSSGQIEVLLERMNNFEENSSLEGMADLAIAWCGVTEDFYRTQGVDPDIQSEEDCFETVEGMSDFMRDKWERGENQ
jgi:hypothetical protein